MEPLAPWRIVAQVLVVASALLLSLVLRAPTLRIVALCMGSMIGYGMVQDQISVRLCPEYFTVAHPPIVGLTEPTLLGLIWGFLGSWWGGLFLGLAVACAATLGSAPPVPPRELVRPLGVFVLWVASVSLICGLGVAYNGRLLGVSLGAGWREQIPAERQQALLIVACAHFGTYASAVVGAILLSLHTGQRRKNSLYLKNEIYAQQSGACLV